MYGKWLEPPTPTNSDYLLDNPHNLTYSGQKTVKIKIRTYKNGVAGPIIYNQYVIVPGVRIAQTDDEVTGSNSFGLWSRWENNMWLSYPDIYVPRPTSTTNVYNVYLKAQQNFKDGTTRKYNVWTDNEGHNYFINHAEISLGTNTSSVLAHFRNANNSTISNLIEGSVSVNNGTFSFKDPWLIDDNSDSKGTRNRGTNPQWGFDEFQHDTQHYNYIN